MAVSRDPSLGMYTSDQVPGYFGSAEEARAAEGSGGYSSGASGFDFLGEGLADTAKAPDDPGNAPNPNNPGGMSDSELARRRVALRTGATSTANTNARVDATGAGQGGFYGSPASAAAFSRGNVGGASGAYNAGSDTTRAAFDATHAANGGASRDTWASALDSPTVRALRSVVDPVYGASQVAKAVAPKSAIRAIDTAANFANAPVATGLQTIGAPAVLQVAADPLGYGRRVAMGSPSEGSLGQTGLLDVPGRVGAAYTDITHPNGVGGAGGAGGAGGSGGGAGASGGLTPPSGKREEAAAGRADNAATQFEQENAKSEADEASAVSDWKSAIDNIEGGNYGLSDEARGYQKEGLAMQRSLLQRALGFDPNQYATQFADQALARQIAAGRSAGGGAAAQQAGIFAAMEQAPSLYAEGARQAASLENQRLSTAEGAAKAFGDLGTMTRSSDENRAQFESNLSVTIADQVGKLSEGRIQLDENQSKQFADIWMNFADLQSRYAGMDSAEQIAWWDTEMKQAGLDQQWAQFKEAQKISGKDLIAGLFQLGGGLLGAGGMIGAAYAGKKS